MATGNDPFGEVYNGQPNTGAAFLLQGNQAANIFNTNIAKAEQQRRVAEYQRQKQLAAEQQNITDNLAKVSPGDYWINHDKEIQADYKNLMDYGTKLKYEGRNPFSDQDFLSQKQQLESKAKFSKQLQDDYKIIQSELLKNPNGYDNADEVSSFFSGEKKISDYMKEGYKRPELVKRYATTDVLEGLKPSTREFGDGDKIVVGADSAQNKLQVLSKVDTPAFSYLLKKAGANPEINAFGTQDKDGLPIFPTDDNYVTERANELLQSPEGLNLLNGKITGPDDPKALSMMKDLVKKQNTAYSKVIDESTNALNAQADSKYRKDDMNARLGLARSAEARQARKEKDDDEQGTVSIGNQDSFIPVLKKGGKVEKEKGSSLMSMNFNNSEVTVQPSRVINQSKGTSTKNTESFNMKAGGVKLVPVFKGVKDEFNDVEVSERQLNDIISGKSKNYSLENITFKPLVYGTRKQKDKYGNETEESVSIPYNAVAGNKEFKTGSFDKAYQQFQELVNNEDFKSLSTEDKFEFLKQNYNLK